MSPQAPGKTLGQVYCEFLYAERGWVLPHTEDERKWLFAVYEPALAAVVRAFLERDGLGDALQSGLEMGIANLALARSHGVKEAEDLAQELTKALATIQEARRG